MLTWGQGRLTSSLYTHQSIIIDLSFHAENIPLEVRNYYACALVGRKRAENFPFSQATNWFTGEIERHFQNPENQKNDLKLTPGFDAEYFSGSIANGDWASGLIAG